MPKQVCFLAAFLWTGVIVFLCLLSSNEIPVVHIPNLDKVVHSFFYFVFTLLWFLFFKKQLSSSDVSKALIMAFIFAILFGIGIEIMQSLFTTTRQGDVMDVLANTSGAVLAVSTIFLYRKFISSNKIQ